MSIIVILKPDEKSAMLFEIEEEDILDETLIDVQI
jgi:hypothetical protein